MGDTHDEFGGEGLYLWEARGIVETIDRWDVTFGEAERFLADEEVIHND